MTTFLLVAGIALLILGLIAGAGYVMLTRSGGLDSLHGTFKRLVLILLVVGFGLTSTSLVIQAL